MNARGASLCEGAQRRFFLICKNHNLHLQTKPTYGGRGYLEKQDFIIEKQKETISEQKEIVLKNIESIKEQKKKIQKRVISQGEKVIKKTGLINCGEECHNHGKSFRAYNETYRYGNAG